MPDTPIIAIGVVNVSSEEAVDVKYANHVQVVTSTNEVIVDFFLLAPSVEGGQISPVHRHTQRIVLPLNTMKGLVTALANVIANWEAETKMSLPNTRAPDPNDKIKIWS